MQKLIGSYLDDFAWYTNVDIIYTIGSLYSNLSIQQNMDKYSFYYLEILYSFY